MDFRSPNRTLLLPVDATMLLTGQDGQVFRPVVVLVAVNMVDLSTGKDSASH
jgi:hypothetical protein